MTEVVERSVESLAIFGGAPLIAESRPVVAAYLGA